MIGFSLLLLMAFAAGFIDAVVGGGGLIQLPALMIYLPDASQALIFGTNKLAGFSGTALATVKYLKTTKVAWKDLMPGVAGALIWAIAGAATVGAIPKEPMKWMVLFLLIAVAIYTFRKKNLGVSSQKTLSPEKVRLYAFFTGSALGFYDGFFGPGTGSFLVFIFVGVFGYEFLQASASAKIINCATNIAALGYFALEGYVQWDLAIPVAIANMTGSWFGAQKAIQQGSSFIRKIFLVIVTASIAKIAWDLMGKS